MAIAEEYIKSGAPNNYSLMDVMLRRRYSTAAQLS